MLINLGREPEMIIVIIAATLFFGDQESRTYQRTSAAKNKEAYINFKAFENMLWENQKYTGKTNEEILKTLNNEWNRRGIYIPEHFSEKLKTRNKTNEN